MKLPILTVALLLSIATAGYSQFYIGLKGAGVDSNPFPNAAVNPFIGYSGNFQTWNLKLNVGYLQTLLPAEDDKSRSIFAGGMFTITPEFILTKDRENPFKLNVGFSGFYGNYYQEETTFLSGGTIGIAWGFGGEKFASWELVADMHLLAAEGEEGTSQGPLHTMAMFGILKKF